MKFNEVTFQQDCLFTIYYLLNKEFEFKAVESIYFLALLALV